MYLAWTNGRWTRQTHRDTENWMKQAHQDTLEILARIEKGQEDARREVVEVRREMAEAIKYVASLIVSEADKTRQALKPS